MVRIILDKAGVSINDNILNAIADKVKGKGFYIKCVTQDKNKAVIIINTDQLASAVMPLITRAEYIECTGCNSVHIRGNLPNDAPFRCQCGKWLLTKTKIK